MITLIEPGSRHERRRQHGLPPIGRWWPRLEHPLQRELVENPGAPLRPFMVRRILDLCDLEDAPLPHRPVRLDLDERAYIAGWAHEITWE
ncbi:hypothetical protein [Agromyces sp. Marseille-Q5079]|uniref:hypothetical protein n=1 Tax=Agromyces sp. Marseille-Q5079 TaxID=3439059 RepID=UPI003D9CB900